MLRNKEDKLTERVTTVRNPSKALVEVNKESRVNQSEKRSNWRDMNLSLGGDETNLFYIMLPRHHKWDIHISSSRRRNIGFYYRFLIVACLLGVKSTH